MLVQKDINRLFCKSAEAYRELGIKLYYGHECAQNLNEATYYLHRAKRMGDKIAEAFLEFASWPILIKHVNADRLQVLCFDKDCIDHPIIQCIIAQLYLDGWGLDINVDESIKWYLKAATLHNSIIAYLGLAMIYDKDIKTRDQALYWLKKAYSTGNHEAIVRLGIFLKDEEPDKAADCFMQLFSTFSSFAINAQENFVDLIVDNKIRWSPKYHSYWPTLPNFKETITILLWIKKVEDKIRLPRPIYYKIIGHLSDNLIGNL